MKRFYTLLAALLCINFLYGQQAIEQGFVESPLNPEFVKYMQNSQVKNTDLKLGEIPSPDMLYFTNTQPYLAPKSLPSSYDLRTEGNVTPVKNQIISEPSWAFGALGAVESSWKKSGYGEFDFSEKNLAGCHGFVSTVCNGGNIKMATAYLTRISGPVLESADPYPASPTCPAGWSCSGSFTSQGLVTEAIYLPGKGTPSFSIDLVKTAIYDHGGVYANMYYDVAYYNSGDYTYYYSGTNTPNNGVVLIGWDDSKVTSSSNPGAWIVKNSLGTSWGESGYFYISYDDTKALTDIAYYPTRAVLESGEAYYGYDKLGPTGSFGWNDGTDWNDYALIKFIATNNQKLKRVGAAVIGAGTTLSFDFYSDFDGTTLTGLMGSMTGLYCEYPGTYYFDVTGDINVSQNDSIFIQVTYNTPNLYNKIPCEMAVSGYAAPQILTKVCWARRNDLNPWRMLGTTQTTGAMKSDLCIKATFTTTNKITFNVTDGLDPLANVTIDFNGNQYLTNVSGQAIAFCQTPGDYDYVASIPCYNEYSGNFTIDGNEIVDIVMTHNPVGVSISDHTDVTCNGLCNGTASASPSGGTGPYTYLWNTSPAQTTQTATGLCQGTYNVTVTDTTGCTATTSVNISQPAVVTANITSQTNVSCNGGSNGQATVTAGGGTPGYSYLWNDPNPPQTTATCTDLTIGTWSVTVTDANSCTAATSVNISQPAVLSLVVTKNNACTSICNGDATATPSGGTTPYTYSWSTIPEQTTQTATDLCADTYYVTVSDANNCTISDDVEILGPGPLSATTDSTNVSCFGGANGTASVTPSGGRTPYTYTWNSSPAQYTSTATGLTAGDYTCTITDDCEATITKNITITQPAVLTSTINKTNTTSAFLCDGSATANPSGGTTPYSYYWNSSPVQTTQTATALCAGTYNLTITDANSCTNTNSTIIPQRLATNLRVVGTPATNYVTLEWDGSGATMYRLRFRKTGYSYFYADVYSSPHTRHLLEPNTNYECSITTFDGGTSCAYSSPIYFTTANGTSYLAQNLRMLGTPTTNSATVEWDGSGATSYQLRLNVSGSTSYSYYTDYVSPYTFGSLAPNTTYQCCIRTYAGGTYNAMSSPISFTTANESSVIATNLRVQGTPLTNDVTMAWDGSGATNYQLRFNVSGSTTYTYNTVYTSPYTKIFLNPNTNYECCIRTNNGGTYTAFSSPVAFTTANGVSYIATNLRVVGTPAATSAVLTWDGSGADWYQLKFNVLGSTSYTYNKVYTSNPVIKTNLLPGTTYQCRIMTCKYGVYSGYSSPISFTTAVSKSMFSEENGLRDLILYPNPASTTLNIEFDSYTNGIYIMEIGDITGRVLLNEVGIIEERNYTIQKDVSSFEKGIYLVRVLYGNDTKVIRFVKE